MLAITPVALRAPSVTANTENQNQKGWGQIRCAKGAKSSRQTHLHNVARYTHRVAISNHRLLAVDDHNVTFRWKDYAHQGKIRTMTLSPQEFLRRFLLHVLPKGFPRIRYFGWMANRRRAGSLLLCRSLLAQHSPLQTAHPATHSAPPAEWQCPHCSGSRHDTERLTQAQILFERMVVVADSS